MSKIKDISKGAAGTAINHDELVSIDFEEESNKDKNDVHWAK